MSILAWIVLGLVAGLIAKAIYPGDQPGGVIATMLLGIVGAMLGGWMGRGFSGDATDGTGLSFMGIIWAVVGSLVVLFVWSLATRRPRRV